MRQIVAYLIMTTFASTAWHFGGYSAEVWRSNIQPILWLILAPIVVVWFFSDKVDEDHWGRGKSSPKGKDGGAA